MPPVGRNLECPTCNKLFCSPGGLGGHMRVHHPARTATILPVPNNGQNNECPICHTSWPSMKSLYGHMSKHQDRPWRGMIPPPPAVENGGGDQVAEGKRAEMMSEEALKQEKKPRFEMGSCSRSTGAEKKYLCSICDREFESYHALGGHKSHHGANSVESSDEAPTGEMETSTARFSFDLNELPPPEEEEMGGVGEK